jgi:phosphatidylinositol dimannoside acyltransferase
MWLLRLLRITAILTPITPARIGYALSDFIGLLFFVANRRARRNIDANLRIVSPTTSGIHRRLLSLRVCITVAKNYYDLIRLRSIDRNSLFDHIDIEGLEHVERALGCGNGVIIVSAHVGNFSAMAKLPSALGLEAAIIAERVEPPQLFNYMARLRSAMGIDVISPGPTAMRKVLRLLQSNGVLLLAADRDVTNQGRTVKFFGRRTTLPSGPVALAMKTGAPLIPAYTVRTSNRHSHVEILEPIQLHRTGNWERDVEHNLAHLTSALESMISTAPGQWAVLQRVWPPTSRYGRSEAIGSADEMVPEEEDSRARVETRRSA